MTQTPSGWPQDQDDLPVPAARQPGGLRWEDIPAAIDQVGEYFQRFGARALATGDRPLVACSVEPLWHPAGECPTEYVCTQGEQ